MKYTFLKCSTRTLKRVKVHLYDIYVYKVFFHAPKCAFNPDPIWDQKWNYMDPWNYFLIAPQFRK